MWFKRDLTAIFIKLNNPVEAPLILLFTDFCPGDDGGSNGTLVYSNGILWYLLVVMVVFWADWYLLISVANE